MINLNIIFNLFKILFSWGGGGGGGGIVGYELFYKIPSISLSLKLDDAKLAHSKLPNLLLD